MAGKYADEFVKQGGADAVLCNEPLSRHTTFRIGGPADYFLEPKSAQQAAGFISVCVRRGIPYFIMGNGSNVLASDEGYRGAVIHIGNGLSNISIRGNEIHAEAGARLGQIAMAAERASLRGFEFAAGIPGTLGGACIMNAGAYGGEMKQVLVQVTSLREDGGMRTRPAEELALGYRTSCFMKEKSLVLSADIRLAHGDAEEIREMIQNLAERRRAKQPLELPSAGSTFKRPEGYYAGKLIMEAGLRGYSVGGAQVSEKHCGFIVNRGGATAEDVRGLIAEVRRRVRENTGVVLVPEVRFLGSFRTEI